MSDGYAERALKLMFRQAKAQFGNAIKGYWFHGDELCPACGGEIDTLEVKGERAVSLNGFMYRQRGILIGYFLCGQCAQHIFDNAEKNPGKQTEVHTVIEMNLIEAYQRYLHSLDA